MVYDEKISEYIKSWEGKTCILCLLSRHKKFFDPKELQMKCFLSLLYFMEYLQEQLKRFSMFAEQNQPRFKRADSVRYLVMRNIRDKFTDLDGYFIARKDILGWEGSPLPSGKQGDRKIPHYVFVTPGGAKHIILRTKTLELSLLLKASVLIS